MPKTLKTPQKSAKVKKTTRGDKSAESESGTPRRRQDAARETIESVVVAFILAFLFRTFAAEAFVIPTGSMAETLLGRHKDVACEQCGIHFMVGASDELDGDEQYYIPENRLKTAICPNCRYENQIREKRVFNGDRILVNKFQFEIGDPKRWDVVVFKYVEDPKVNYIKRLVGLPGESLRIKRGDVYARKGDTDEWQILRKDDPGKQRLLQLLVYDNNHPERGLHELGWPRRWLPVKKEGSPDAIAGWSKATDGWQGDSESHSFQLNRDATADGRLRWLRYQHIIPRGEHWDTVKNDDPSKLAELGWRPQLISDFCGYNAYTGGQSHQIDYGYYWVGDLTLSCRVDVSDSDDKAELLFELNEGYRRYRCKIDLNSGTASLFFLDDFLDKDQNAAEERMLSTAQTELTGAGSYDVTFANVDDRLCLWVDDRLIEFDSKGEYHPPTLLAPRDEDMIPVGIAAKGANVQVSNLLIERDTYYRAEQVNEDDFGNRPVDRSEYDRGPYGRESLADLLNQPNEWYREYIEHARTAKFGRLDSDEFFVMGDNSPRSKDSRLWPNTRRAKNRHAVPRSALVGKGFFIYWPHAIPFGANGNGYAINVPGLERYFYHRDRHGQFEQRNRDGEIIESPYPKHSVPFYPNVKRMHRIR